MTHPTHQPTGIPPISTRVRARVGLVGLAAALLAAPAAAIGAEAPLRLVGIDPSGTATASIQPIAISPDGKEVLGNWRGTAVIRDVVAGKTSELLPIQATPVSATPDLNRIVLDTKAPLSGRDNNGDNDLYVYDRAARTFTLVSQDPVTGSLNQARPFGYERVSTDAALISGNGKVVIFTAQHISLESGMAQWVRDQYRFDLPTNKLTRVADVTSTGAPAPVAIDDAGQIVLNSGGISIGARKLPLPIDPAKEYQAAIAADGSAVAFFSSAARTKISVVNTASGAVITLPLPTWLQTQVFRLQAVTSGGAKVVLSTTLARPAGPRYAFAALDRTGAITQVGGDVLLVGDATAGPITQNLQFAATSLNLAQLGTTPLPGSNPPPAPNTSVAWNYVTVRDVSCTTGLFGNKTWFRAWVDVKKGPVGAESRTATSATFSVYETSTKKIINAFTYAPPGTRELTVGRTGGWSYSVRIAMSDGSTITDTVDIPRHEPDLCPFVL